ncbi:MAG TPA: hypothetical protein VGK29_27180 [Paludibaculum sp.]|jgi:hypothetical protein
MSLLKMSDKKLAANRANARLSRGPSSAAGKEKVSRNACRHHLYARKHFLPPEWEARILATVDHATAEIENPVERAAAARYLFFIMWQLELYALEARLIDESIAHHGCPHRGAHAYFMTDPLALPIQDRYQRLFRHIERARKAWEQVKRNFAPGRSIPQLTENTTPVTAPKPLVMAAAAGAASSITRQPLPQPIYSWHTPLPKPSEFLGSISPP